MPTKPVSGLPNGNISDYLASNGVVVSHREFDPYGNTTAATGAMVNNFNFWFSSKYLDQETGLYYYGCRYYSPELGRWPSRDPAHEHGGPNECAFVENAPAIKVDPLGEFSLAVNRLAAIKPDGFGFCGQYHFKRFWKVTLGKGEMFPSSSAIAQRIEASLTWERCDGKPVTIQKSFTEAFEYSGSFPKNFDNFSFPEFPENTKGSGFVVGKATYYTGLNKEVLGAAPWEKGTGFPDLQPWEEGPVQEGKGSWGEAPHFFGSASLPTPSSNEVVERLDFSWNCCCDPTGKPQRNKTKGTWCPK
jgi:RHS repeat-associated protein